MGTTTIALESGEGLPRNSHHAIKYPTNSLEKSFTPKRVSHQREGSNSESCAALTRTVTFEGKTRPNIKRVRRV